MASAQSRKEKNKKTGARCPELEPSSRADSDAPGQSTGISDHVTAAQASLWTWKTDA